MSDESVASGKQKKSRLKRATAMDGKTRIAALDQAYVQAVAAQMTHLADEEARFRQAEQHVARRWTFLSSKTVTRLLPHLTLARHVQRVLTCVLGRTTRRSWVTSFMIAGILCMLALLGIGGTSVLARPISFSFARETNCAVSPTLLPGLIADGPNTAFTISRPVVVSLFNKPLFSALICATSAQPVRANATYADRQALHLFGVHTLPPIEITTDSYPKLVSAKLPVAAVPLLQPVTFALTTSDAVFGYALAAGDRAAPCDRQASNVVCSLLPLRLAYSTTYVFTLERLFQGRVVGVVLTQRVQTITAAAISTSSIQPGAIIYDKPQQVVLTVSKPLRSVKGITLSAAVNGATAQLALSYSFTDKTITITVHNSLPRRATIMLRVAQVTARDGSQLEQPYELSFTTSGGPRVIGVNIPASGVALQPSIIITFDQPLANNSATGLVSVTAGGIAQTIAATISGNQVRTTPVNGLPRCAQFTLQTSSAAVSQYGFSGDSAWTYGSRAECYIAYSIGTSVRGRAIMAYQFGSGSSKIVYQAGIHGNESNTRDMLDDWIDELDANPDRIPGGRMIIVIPALNPDGLAANTRENAHMIDLNRNFPANDWQTQVTEPGGSVTNEGGPSPLSESESQTVAAFIQAQQPRLVLSYHSRAGIVQSNAGADADQLMGVYANAAGYEAVGAFAAGSIFDYSTTGSFEDWTREKLGRPVLLVELYSKTADEFYRNKTAMWAMAQLPV